MDWVKLFTLMVALLFVEVTAQGTRKKIRIHLPQKVKHIHHHKKIYITNHSAASQYAPAYLPTAEGAVAVPTTVALPTVAELVPLKPMQLFEERQTPPLQGASAAASKLLPLYRARGYYGPSPEWEEQEYDLVPPPESLGPIAAAAVLPSAFSSPSAPIVPSPSKRVKVVKVSESPRKKKVVRKRKPPKRIIVQDMSREEERPVSTYHEHFYSDVEGSGTIKKIKKPKRVEKIIDGDTEHIHTYSEEHIHKLVFDDAPKITGVTGVDPTGSMSSLTNSHPLIPIKNSQSLLALDHPGHHSEFGPGGFSELAAIGSLGTPSQFEYASYNPREVTHDHIFHDHGELPPHLDITKESLGHPPKVSYTSQGLKINGVKIKSRSKNKWAPAKNIKPTRPTPSIDFSYYENMYSPPTKQKTHRPSHSPQNYFDDSSESNIDDFRPIPSFKFKEKPKFKNPVYSGYHKPSSFRLGQESVPIPYTTPTSFIQPTKSSFQGMNGFSVGFANFKDPFSAFKDGIPNNFEYDTFASPSNLFNKDNAAPSSSSWPIRGNKKKKSISTQNISFGGQDHKTVVDHLGDSSSLSSSKESVLTHPTSSIQNFENFNLEKADESGSPSMEYTITENSPIHEYYTSMALKAFQEDPMSVPDASNTNFQFVEAPTMQTTDAAPGTPIITTVHPLPTFSEPLESTTIDDIRENVKSQRPSRLRTRSKSLNIQPRPIAMTQSPDISNGRNKHRIRHTPEQDRRGSLHHFEANYQKSKRAERNFDVNRQEADINIPHPSVASQFKYGDKL